jgi:hypothetical protein
MKKKVAAITVFVMVALLCVAGCTVPNTGNPSPSESPTTKDNATVSNTALSSGTYTATFEGKSVNLKAAYIVNGLNATVNGGTYKSTSSDEVVFLVVNGGHLTIKEATVDKQERSVKPIKALQMPVERSVRLIKALQMPAVMTTIFMVKIQLL